jgi:ATP-dependent RNA helicase DDX10/DBP4
VLDEADRILDLGFKRTLNAIMAHLPKSRQTLLFSATQTKSIKDLARLSLKDPISLSASAAAPAKDGAEAGADEDGAEESDERALWVTPKGLEQHYAVVELHRKLDVLFSFIKTHLKSKIIVFMSSCKQVRRLCLAGLCRRPSSDLALTPSAARRSASFTRPSASSIPARPCSSCTASRSSRSG